MTFDNLVNYYTLAKLYYELTSFQIILKVSDYLRPTHLESARNDKG